MERTKAAATVCVICIHVFYGLGFRDDLIGRVIFGATIWGVPAFFFISGFLNSRSNPYPRGQVWRWCWRLFPMYVPATCLALLYRHYELHEAVGMGDLPLALLVGSGWGIYYFVPVLFGALCVSIVLARFPKAAIAALAVFLPALFVIRWKWELDPLVAVWGMFGMFRSPFFWWGYFISGWVAAPYLRRHREAPRWITVALVVSAISSIALLAATADWQFSAVRALLLASAPFPMLLAVFYISTEPASDVTLRLSGRSYEIYLWHFFVVDFVTRRLASRGGGFGTAVVLSAAVVGASVLADRLFTNLSGSATGTSAKRRSVRRSHGV